MKRIKCGWKYESPAAAERSSSRRNRWTMPRVTKDLLPLLSEGGSAESDATFQPQRAAGLPARALFLAPRRTEARKPPIGAGVAPELVLRGSLTDFRAERGEGAGVLAADHAGANHRHFARQAVDIENCVRVVNLRTVEGKGNGANRSRPDRNQEMLPSQ